MRVWDLLRLLYLRTVLAAVGLCRHHGGRPGAHLISGSPKETSWEGAGGWRAQNKHLLWGEGVETRRDVVGSVGCLPRPHGGARGCGAGPSGRVGRLCWELSVSAQEGENLSGLVRGWVCVRDGSTVGRKLGCRIRDA